MFRSRQAVVSLELLLTLPVLIVLLLGIIELSLIYEVDKRVAYASRFGAKLASETTRDQAASVHLGNLALSGELRRRLNHHLQTAGLSEACGVILEHNACVPNQVQWDVDSDCPCEPPPESLPGGEPSGAAYARVTVCLPLKDNVADLLANFGGFTVADGMLRHSTTFRIEDDNQPPRAAFTTFGTVAAATPNLPVATPPVGLVRMEVPANNAVTIPLAFHAGITTDREQPLSELQFRWSMDTDGDGILESTSVGIHQQASFTPPPPGRERDYLVVLTAIDGCLAAHNTQLRIRISRDQP